MANIYPYKLESQSAKLLAEALGVKRIKHEGKALKADHFINWGASQINRELRGIIINKPEAVAIASDKLLSFRAFKEQGVCIPEFTESREEASKWLAEGVVVVARTKLRAHSGEGIVIHDPDKMKEGEQIPNAKLYTKYVPKAEEYRIHVSNRIGAFFIQRKARDKDVPDEKVNWKVRNHGNGFIYANQEVDVFNSAEAYRQCEKAIEVLGLDFGAVDIVYNRKHNKHYVLEVNTAPGLTGSTLTAYTNMLRGL